jgi:hypothetical protein
LLQQFKKSEDTGEVKKLEVKPYEQTVAQKVKGGFVRGLPRCAMIRS